MRLDDVKESLGDQISIEWKSFMLRSSPEGGKTREEFIEYTRNWERMPAADSRLEVTAPWGSDDAHPSHSLPALAASKLIAEHGPQVEEAFHRLTFKAYFYENRTISDLDVLASIAEDSGVDADDFAAAYRAREQELSAQVIQDHNEAIALGINAVPTTIVDGTLAIRGAHETDSYLSAIRDIIADR